MEPELAQALRALVGAQPVAALGTLHAGEPFVSMVPYAVSGSRFVIHVSALAAHTKDMLQDPRVSLLVIAPPAAGVAPQALARLTIQGDAARIAADAPHYAAARDAYLRRFPDSEPMFGFGDFSLFEIAPRSARFVGGFAQAKSLGAESLAQALAQA